MRYLQSCSLVARMNWRINTNPGDITEPDIRYLFTTALTEMKPMDYRQWFYDFRYMLQWGQVTARVEKWRPHERTGHRRRNWRTVYRVMLATHGFNIWLIMKWRERPSILSIHQGDDLPDNGLLGYSRFRHVWINGLFGSFKARYTDPPLLTPKHDTQEELFDILLQELEETINTLTNPVTFEGRDITQVSLGKQDLIYDGDVAKWANLPTP